ncbi:phosphoenolpyruvate synthase [Anaeromyxobacter terrae]|uniref:phosphoenolpyruvate synthase n=1 Tax=Anaeromyxobacter terrae TaxID=2925406 RepID=UPI001F5A69BE|nr:phosphoenolpyruvate synthase [Anaeromyxobacter sp. SG22]
MRWIRELSQVGLDDVAQVGGKNASSGELLRALVPLGIRVPGGFATTAEAYRSFLRASALEEPIRALLRDLRKDDTADLERRSRELRRIVASAPLPPELEAELVAAYQALSRSHGEAATDVAVRSSATAEDLPTASFAGQHESFLNVRGAASVLRAVRDAYASLFTPRAISYRADMGFDQLAVALSVGVQKMVRSDVGSAGVIFTLDTETGHRGVVIVTSSFGLGESVVQGRVVPDQFTVHKQALRRGFRPIVRKKLGTKETCVVYGPGGDARVREVPSTPEQRAGFSLEDDDVLTLARWALLVEDHYSRRRGADTPMDIEWAKDGVTGELFVVQARPETVMSQRKGPSLRVYRLRQEGEAVTSGLAVGEAIAAGTARVVRAASELPLFQPGEILVSVTTDPDWEPVMKRAAAIVTERGGRTSHAAIVARELGIPAIVGTGDATTALATGERYTVSCAQGETGEVYAGELAFDVEELDPARLARPHTRMMLNVATPEKAYGLALLPNDGVGLARMEFIFADWVGIHPLALTRFDTLAPEVQREIEARTAGYPDKREYFVDRLSQGVGTLAAAFWPRPVILRFSDFKTNEYARLLGGEPFEPKEENPMLGWRGASRYYHPEYREGFLLEVAAVRRVRETFGLRNLAVMIPFCRTPAEGAQVLEAMREGGLVRGRDGLEVYVMAEIPSNALLAADFARLFDGFSIGSNDLTQLTLGIDRDSARIAPLFDERSPAVKALCAMLIDVAHRAGRKVGICGQAPSDYPEFAAFLVERGIDSLSLNADAILRTTRRVLEEERRLASRAEAEASSVGGWPS